MWMLMDNPPVAISATDQEAFEAVMALKPWCNLPHTTLTHLYQQDGNTGKVRAVIEECLAVASPLLASIVYYLGILSDGERAGAPAWEVLSTEGTSTIRGAIVGRKERWRGRCTTSSAVGSGRSQYWVVGGDGERTVEMLIWARAVNIVAIAREILRRRQQNKQE